MSTGGVGGRGGPNPPPGRGGSGASSAGGEPARSVNQAAAKQSKFEPLGRDTYPAKPPPKVLEKVPVEATTEGKPEVMKKATPKATPEAKPKPIPKPKRKVPVTVTEPGMRQKAVTAWREFKGTAVPAAEKASRLLVTSARKLLPLAKPLLKKAAVVVACTAATAAVGTVVAGPVGTVVGAGVGATMSVVGWGADAEPAGLGSELHKTSSPKQPAKPQSPKKPAPDHGEAARNAKAQEANVDATNRKAAERARQAKLQSDLAAKKAQHEVDMIEYNRQYAAWLRRGGYNSGHAPPTVPVPPP